MSGKTCQRLVAKLIAEQTGRPMAEILPPTSRMPVRPVKIGIIGGPGMSKDADVIVIGGGVIGSSVTYQLAKLGKKVLQIEREDLTRGAAGATDGVVGYHTKKAGASDGTGYPQHRHV